MQTRSYATKHMMDMEHEHPCHPPHERVFNVPHYHAFMLLGKEKLFASHLTQLWCEMHMYQFIIEVSLPEPARSVFTREREAHPKESYFLANTMPDKDIGNLQDDPMTMPEIAGRLRTSFIGNVFRGIAYKDKYEDWPWRGMQPLIANTLINVERIVHFRPFSQTTNYPDKLTYLLFGAGNEAHIVHYQTKMPDYDHIASLRIAPSWLANDLLAAGILVDLPDIPRVDKNDQSAGLRCSRPFEDGATIQSRYRGDGPRRPITVSHTYWFCTKICNFPDPCPQYGIPCGTPPPDTG